MRTRNHSKHHCTDTHWHESPPIQKRVSSCGSDGGYKSTTTSIGNLKQLRQYTHGLANEHCDHPTGLCGTLHSISGIPNHRKHHHHGHEHKPKLLHHDLNHGTAHEHCNNPHPAFVYANAVRHTITGCHTYGDIDEMIKELPAAGVFIVNHEFIDLLILEILDCLPTVNMSHSTVCKIKEYVAYYYEYFDNIEAVGSLHLNVVMALDANLLVDPAEVGRIKAVLTALDGRLKRRLINAWEQ